MAKNTSKNNPVKTSPAKPSPKTKASSPKRDASLYLFAIATVVLTFIVFKSCLSLEFVNWDDPFNILENKTLDKFSTQWDWQSVKAIFTTGVIGNYNPLPILSFAFEKYFFAPDPVLNPFIFHFNNLAMHLICTLLVYLLFIKLNVSKTAAFLGAMLFGIHPMRVESVAWITERKDVLYGMFFLAALLCYIQYLNADKHKARWYLLTIVISVLSYFSKVQAVTLPLTMVALDFYFKRNWSSPKILILEKLPWWVLSLSFGLINIWFLKEQNSLNAEGGMVDFGIIDKLAIGAYSYSVYIIKWIYPYRMSPLYPYTTVLPKEVYIALAAVPILLAVFLVWAIRTKKNNLLFGWMFFTFNVMFLLQIVGAGQGFLADRFTYIAYIGLFFLAIKGYDWLAEQKPAYKTPLLVGAGLYLTMFAFITAKQIRIWKNSETLWSHTRALYPDNPVPWKMIADYYRDDKKEYAKAILNYQQAVKLQPKNADNYNVLAKAYFDQAFNMNTGIPGFKQQQINGAKLAVQNYNTAIEKDLLKGQPDKKTSGELIINRGIAYALAGNIDKAFADLSEGIKLYPKSANAYMNRSLLYYNAQQFELCIKDCDEYLLLEPSNADMYNERGLCKLMLNRPAEAIPDFTKAIEIKPAVSGFYLSRAQAYKMTGNTDASLRDARQAKKMGAQVSPELL